MKKPNCGRAMAALLIPLLLSGCGPDVRTDYPRDTVFAVDDPIHVYDMDTGDQRLTLLIHRAVITSDQAQTLYIRDGTYEDDSPRYREESIQQIIELEYTYTVLKGYAKTIHRVHFDVEDETGQKGLEYPADGDLELNQEGDTITAVASFALRRRSSSLLVTFTYSGFKTTARIRVPLEQVQAPRISLPAVTSPPTRPEVTKPPSRPAVTSKATEHRTTTRPTTTTVGTTEPSATNGVDEQDSDPLWPITLALAIGVGILLIVVLILSLLLAAKSRTSHR